MKTLRVLIVEDDPLLALDLGEVISEIVPAVVIRQASIAGTKKVLDEQIDFAFLDVDVTDGKTFEVAHILAGKRIPFVFVSGSQPDDLPPDLRTVPFISKPVARAQIERVLFTSDSRREYP